MRRRDANEFEIEPGALIFGLIAGLLVGALVALFKFPKTGKSLREDVSTSLATTSQQLRARVEAAIPTDPVAESLAEGKAAARRRRGELGLDS
jgi:gas vesicle protein